MTGSSSESTAAYYPIRVVASETGINAITLRAWERRYGLIEPKRTAKGHRLYTEQDIKLIKQIVSLLNRGIPISQAQAMVANGETLPDSGTGVSKPSQWQVYREQLANACQQFDERALAKTFDEVCQFFPVEMALRFLFIPFAQQLREQSTHSLGPARISLYESFLYSRLAWRLSDNSQPADTRVLIANCTRDSEIDLLFLALLVRQFGLGITHLSHLTTAEQIIQLIKECKQWPVMVLQVERMPDSNHVQQYRKVAIETGMPVFVIGAAMDAHPRLKEAGLIPLMSDDLQNAALTVRDIIEGMTA